jgi:hypothetical protein
MVDGEIIGTWRRSQHSVTIQPWLDLPATTRDAVAAEALSLPLPSLDREIGVSWMPVV